jgi:hypothetical protein
MTPDFVELQQNAVQVNTSAGKLWLYPHRSQDLEAFAGLSGDTSPRERLRSFLPCIAFRLVPDAVDGTAPSIDVEWCRQLSDEDLERVADAYAGSVLFTDVPEDGARAAASRRGVAYETAIERLDRLLTLEHARHREETRKASELFREQFGAAFATLSDGAGKQFSGASELAANSEQDPHIAPEAGPLSTDADVAPELPHQPEPRALEPTPPSDAARFDSPETVAAGFDSPETVDPTAARAEEFDTSGATRDHTLGDLSFDAATPPALASEGRPEAAKDVASSRTALRVAIGALALSMLLAAGAVIFSMQRYAEEKRVNEAMSKWQESVSQMIKDSQTAQDRRLQSLEEKLAELGARQNALEAARAATPPEPAPPPKRAVKATRTAKSKRSSKP